MYIKTKMGNTAHVFSEKCVSDETIKAIEHMVDMAYYKIKNKKMINNALWLVAEGEYVFLKIEINGEWVTLVKERLDSPFSHIIEAYGIQNKIQQK